MCVGGALGVSAWMGRRKQDKVEGGVGGDAFTIKTAANPRKALELGGRCTVVLHGGQGSGTGQSKDVVVVGQ